MALVAGTAAAALAVSDSDSDRDSFSFVASPVNECIFHDVS